MNPNEYARLDGVALAAAIKRGDVSAMEVTEAAIGVVEKLNPKLNAVVMTNFDNARDAAKDVLADTALAGVPFLLKSTVTVESHKKVLLVEALYWGLRRMIESMTCDPKLMASAEAFLASKGY